MRWLRRATLWALIFGFFSVVPACAASYTIVLRWGPVEGVVENGGLVELSATDSLELAVELRYADEVVTDGTVVWELNGTESEGWEYRVGIEDTPADIVVTVQPEDHEASVFTIRVQRPDEIIAVQLGAEGPGTVELRSPVVASCDEPECDAVAFERTPSRLLLEARPSNGAKFVAWSGACEEATGPNVDLDVTTVSANVVCRATFESVSVLQIEVVGPGGLSLDGGPACTDTCVNVGDPGRTVSVTPVPGAHATFVGWDGDCAEQPDGSAAFTFGDAGSVNVCAGTFEVEVDCADPSPRITVEVSQDDFTTVVPEDNWLNLDPDKDVRIRLAIAPLIPVDAFWSYRASDGPLESNDAYGDVLWFQSSAAGTPLLDGQQPPLRRGVIHDLFAAVIPKGCNSTSPAVGRSGEFHINVE